jgi:hypothetical protein
MAFYSALPTQHDAVASPLEAARTLDRWARAHPELATRFPAAAVLRNARAFLATRE